MFRCNLSGSVRTIEALIVAGLLALLAGCGTLQFGVEASSTRAPVPTATETLVTQTASASPTSTAPATSTPIRVTFPTGSTEYTFTTELAAGRPRGYVLQIRAQQKMTISASPQADITVFDPQNQVVQGTAKPGEWQGTLPQTADYVVLLEGLGLTTVRITIPPSGS